MIHLSPHNGIPRHILLMMAIMAGFTVANLYYNQPLLDMICRETGITQVEANLITVVTQIGYALGLLFVVPLADMVPVREMGKLFHQVQNDLRNGGVGGCRLRGGKEHCRKNQKTKKKTLNISF